MALGYADRFAAGLWRREPRIPLEGVRMARHAMWVNGTKAERELGFQPGSVEAALQRAVDWYLQNGYVSSQRPGIRQRPGSESDVRPSTRIG